MLSIFKNRLGREIDLVDLRREYRKIPERVLLDLAPFCYANDPSPRNGDLFVQGIYAGRRDVWLHLMEFLHLTDDELAELYRGRSVYIGGTEN